MSNLKTLKLRIKSVGSTQKMTKAMKMVAASKLRRAKQAVEISRPYSKKIGELISDLASNISMRGTEEEHFALLTGRGNTKVHLLVVLSSDRGLCGGLNTATVKQTKIQVELLEKDGKEVKILCVGRKAYDQIKLQHGDKVIDKVFGIFKDNITTNHAKEISEKIIALFKDKQFDVCEVIYNTFKSAICQEVTKKQIIPAPINYLHNAKPEANNMPIAYEPSKESLLEALLPRNLEMQLYNELLENSASEQGARMAAMESATNNAGKMIKELTLVYNRTRQANITRELIDIVSGANAV